MAWQEADFRRWMQEHDQGSYDALARTLLERWPAAAGVPPKARSLSVLLGRLAKGQNRWFQEHLDVTGQLAELLGREPEELLGSQAEPVWTFDEFRALRPLELVREAPCDLAELLQNQYRQPEPWLTLVPSQYQALWISAPPGAGKQLRAAFHEVRFGALVRKVSQLRDVRGLDMDAPQRHLLLLLSEADPEHDEDLLRQLGQRGNVTVLAPFPLPKPRQRPDADAASSSKTESPWIERSWQPYPDWRLRFLKWVKERLGRDSLLDAQQLHEWLQREDAPGHLFRTPGDLLPLCALVHDKGERWLTKLSALDLAARLVDEQIAAGEVHDDVWLQGSGSAVLRALARRRLQDLDAPLRGGLPRDRWVGWLPEEQAPRSGPAPEQVKQQLQALAAQPDRRQQEQAIEELTGRLTRPDPREAVARLVRARFLRADESGLALLPRFAAEAWSREAVRDLLAQDRAGTWGLLAVEAERRRLLDEALDAQADRELLALVRQVLAEFDRGCLGDAGAIEALFEAVGRRLAAGLLAPKELLQDLWRKADCVRGRQFEGGPRVTLTRWSAGEQCAHLAACWQWSFRIPAPADLPEDAPGWMWPGWRPPVFDMWLANTISYIGHMRPSWFDGESVEGFDDLLALVPDFLRRCPPQELPEHQVPAIFLADLVLLVETEDIPLILSESHYRDACMGWQSVHLAQRMEGLPLEQRRRLSIRLWQAGSTEQHPLFFFQRLEPALRDTMGSAIPVEAVREALAPYAKRGGETFLSVLPYLPEHLQAEAERWCVEQPDLTVHRLVRDFRCPSRGSGQLAPSREQRARLLVAWLELRGLEDFQLCQLLWELAPDVALDQLKRTWRRDCGAQQTAWWFSSAPLDLPVLESMIELVAQTPSSQRPAWVELWLTNRIRWGGSLATRLYALLRSLGPVPLRC